MFCGGLALVRVQTARLVLSRYGFVIIAQLTRCLQTRHKTLKARRDAKTFKDISEVALNVFLTFFKSTIGDKMITYLIFTPDELF